MITITFEIWEDEDGIKLKGHGKAQDGATTAECDFADAILPQFMEFAYAKAAEMGLSRVVEHKPFTIIRKKRNEDHNRG